MTQAGSYRLNNHCGPEQSITAGKSYMTQVTILTMIAAYISGDEELLDTLDKAPEIVTAALTIEAQVRDVVRFTGNRTSPAGGTRVNGCRGQ